ncbi:hypothetical protein Tco_0613132 [Tanacetum coccineum]
MSDHIPFEIQLEIIKRLLTKSIVQFRVCPITSDPKLVRMNTIGHPTVLNWEIMKDKSFTKILSIKAPNSWVLYRVLELRHNGEAIIETIDHTNSSSLEVYEPSSGRTSGLGINGTFDSLSLNSHKFGQVSLPGWLLRMNKFKISKVYESLGFLEYYTQDKTRFCDVWIMKDKSFTKILSIKALNSWVLYRVLELRHNGEAIIETIDHTNSSSLEVYEPSSGRSIGLGINGTFDSLRV